MAQVAPPPPPALSFPAGGQKIIQEAVKKPGDPQIQEEAWAKMLPLVKNLIELKEAYSKLNQVPPSLAPSP